MDAGAERIQFLPAVALTMHWVNRPTTQGLSTFGRLGRTPPRGACAQRRTFASIGARPRGTGLAIRVRPREGAPVSVDLLRVGSERRTARRGVVVTRFGTRRGDFRSGARGRGLPDGWYVVRFRGKGRDGRVETRHVALHRVGGTFRTAHAFERRRACGALAAATLQSPVFDRARPLRVVLTLAERARVTLDVRRRGRLVRRTRARTYRAGRHVVRFSARGLRPGDHRVTVKVAGGRPVVLRARGLARG